MVITALLQIFARARSLAAAGGTLALALFLGNGVLGQPPKPATSTAEKWTEDGRFVPHAPGRRFLGVSACFRCHNERPGDPGEAPAKAPIDFPRDGWIRDDEYLIFSRHDKHVQAFTVLLAERASDAKGPAATDIEPLAVRMAKVLGVVDKDNKSLIHRDVRCLTCHVGMPLSELKLADGNLVAADAIADFRLNLGVSCEACHGASGDGDQRGWNAVHQEGNKATWRFLSPQAKRERFGYYDVHDPIARTKLCVSCHVGNVAMGRVVTHEMYAAGHPPLSSFEVESYLAQMPPHWLELNRKPKELLEEFLREQQRPAADTNSLLHARNLAVGALITFSESLRLSADLADDGATFPTLPKSSQDAAKVPSGEDAPKQPTQAARFVKPSWPEFSQFACYACHHELRSPSWRQERGFRTIAGRPVFHEWPAVLLQPALTSLGKERELAEPMERMIKLLNARPFGESEAVSRELRQIADWAEATAKALDRGAFTREIAAQLLNECVRLASTTAPDYDAARQLAFACNVIYQDMKRSGFVAYNGSDQPGWYRDRSQLDAVEQALSRLQTDAASESPLDLLLDLHQGQRRFVIVPSVAKTNLRPLDDIVLADVLKRSASYDPGKLNARFREIERLLGGKMPAPKSE